MPHKLTFKRRQKKTLINILMTFKLPVDILTPANEERNDEASAVHIAVSSFSVADNRECHLDCGLACFLLQLGPGVY